MENNQELIKILEHLEKSNRKQVRYARFQCMLSIAAALCFGFFIFTVWKLMPELHAFAVQAEEFVVQAEVIMTNLEEVSTELAKVEFTQMINDVDALVQTSQSSIEETMEKMNSIDIETLNTAIDGLARVVEPLAKFFNVFD